MWCIFIKVYKFCPYSKHAVFLAHDLNITPSLVVDVRSPILIKRKVDPFQSSSSRRWVIDTVLWILQENKTETDKYPTVVLLYWLTYLGNKYSNNLSLKVWKPRCESLPCHEQTVPQWWKRGEEKPRKCFNWFVNAPKCEQAWWSVKRDVTPVWQSCHSRKGFL